MSQPWVPFDDRGLAYGDGVFETVLLHDGQPVLWQQHVERLLEGCQRLMIDPPSPAALSATWQAAPTVGWEVLKIIVTRGSGGRGYAIPDVAAPRLMSRRVPFQPDSSAWSKGVSVRICSLRLARQPRLAGIKHLNRLENVLARQEWQATDYREGLLADNHGLVVEATSMNLFWEQNGCIMTPTLDQCGVEGTLRAALIDAQLVTPAQLAIDEVAAVDRLWLANSVQGVWPVNALWTAEGAPLRRWGAPRHDPLQAVAHPLLGYPATS
ncbi:MULTISPECIES: aminodeoxychorismate lyase [Halomonadaceae]|jgi:4-amino-4-deoxychorismate lyase|uniref:aminodeoxychorismate lyase n=1 Tax=Halomonadaceae TaxID=28256 RepID=UPI000A281254|nr:MULTISPECIES: aminodeoxychorismate lyase [Halomonas]MCW4148282.1 aminodeoxychorismate lyase [Halomonas sp. 18H]MDR5885261.1 aminodeoxychorismate lyase [Halomonas janggokensis]QPL44693.1 aminodeoxychorismate lyase [Halomonas sp. A40-4]